MPTYEGMARELGVSKQTIRNWVKRLDPQRAHVDTSGDTHVIDEALASMVAHKIAARTSDPEHVREGERLRREALASVVEVSDSEIERQRAHFEELLRLKEEASSALLAEKDERIRDLKEQLEDTARQLAQERAAHDATRRSLALSRELEGFKWPWQKREIRARHMLPAPSDTSE